MKCKNEKPKFNYSKLRGRIVEMFGSSANFAKAADMSLEGLSKKLNNKTSITQKEICKWIGLLNIAHEEIGAYFFNFEVQDR